MPILTPDTSASLLVTVYFEEKQGGFMRISWQGTQGAQVLSDNFYEDVGMSNQRSLLIPPGTLVGDGTLIFQCGDSTLGIHRIKLEWLQNKNGLVSPDIEDTLVTPTTGPTQMARDLSGTTTATEPAAWQDQVVTIPLTDGPLRIEQGVEFSVDLDKVPTSARVALVESGLPLGEHLVAWVNGTRAGTITPTVPDLLDAGFLTDATASTSYIGWRDGSFFLPVKLLKSGVNTVQFSDEDDTAVATSTSPTPGSTTQEAPVAVKNLVLQLNYVPAPTPAGFLPPELSLTPASPIAPAASTAVSSTSTP
jgi:hypothetical protein